MLVYSSALLIGLLLGLLGGGGSTLALPVLVYLIHIEPVLATAYSLVIVGVSSCIGAGEYVHQGIVEWHAVVWFGIPSIVGVFVTRSLLLPAIPETVCRIGDSKRFAVDGGIRSSDVSGWSMVCKRVSKSNGDEVSAGRARVDLLSFLIGFVVGMVTGLFGAGGGFMVVPALAYFAKLDVRRAIGTSLVVIAMKSLLGLPGDRYLFERFDW